MFGPGVSSSSRTASKKVKRSIESLSNSSRCLLGRPTRCAQIADAALTKPSSIRMDASLTHDQRWHLAVREHLHSLAAKQQASDGAAAV